MQPPPRGLLVLAWATSVATLVGLLPTAVPHLDWINHCWMLTQVATGWLRDGLPPLFLHGIGRQGEPWLLFYGLGVYVPLAPLAWALGAPAAIKVAAVAIHALLGFRVAQLAWHGTGSARVSACVSILVLCAVFPVSDLCARGAVVEFFSYELFGVALVSLALGWDRGLGPRGPLLIQALCAATLGALAHPPTFLLGALFLLPVVTAFLWALGWQGLSRRQSAAVLLVLVLCLATVAIYLAAVLPSLPKLGIRSIGHSHVLTYFDATIDHPLARFSPLPLDLRVDGKGPGGTPSPRLSAPFHGALAFVLLAAWLGARRSGHLARGAVAAALLGLFAVVAALALSLPIWPAEDLQTPEVRFAAADSLPSRLLAPAEFAYRLVGAQDLLLVLLTCLTFSRLRGRDAVGAWLLHPRAGGWLLLFCTGLGVAGVVLENAEVLRTGEPADSARLLAEAQSSTWPSTFYAQGTFAMPRVFPLLGPTAPVAVVVPTRAGRGPFRRRLRIDCASPCSVVTDVVPTRFVAVSVNGRPWPRSELRCSGPPLPESASRRELRLIDKTRRVAFALPAGRHRVQITLLPGWAQALSPALVAVAVAALLAQIAYRKLGLCWRRK